MFRFRSRVALVLGFVLVLMFTFSAAFAQTVTPPASYDVDSYTSGALDLITTFNLFPLIVVAALVGIAVMIVRRVRRAVM